MSFDPRLWRINKVLKPPPYEDKPRNLDVWDDWQRTRRARLLLNIKVLWDTATSKFPGRG